MHVSVRECKKSSSRWRTEEMSAFSVCFCPAHPFPAELHFFPQTKLHFSRPCLSVPRWRAQRTRAPAIRLDPQCTSCQTSRFLSFLIGTLRPLGTSPYVGTGTTCFLHKLWTLWDGLVSVPWQLIPLDSEFSTQWSPISTTGWIKCLLFSVAFCPTPQIYEPALVNYKWETSWNCQAKVAATEYCPRLKVT